MDYFFEISIIIFTAIITIIPFTGDLWLKKKNKIKFYKKGIAFLVFSVLGLLFAIIHIIKEINEQNVRDTTQGKTFDNTEKIITRVELSALEMETKLARIDSLNVKLDSLNSKTLNSINERNAILDNFNELDTRLSKIYQQEELKIKQGNPLVNIFDKVEWEIEDKVYKIKLIFTNTGIRVAKDFDFKVTYFELNQNNVITSYDFLTKELNEKSDIPREKKPIFRIPVNQTYFNDNDLRRGYIIVTYNYNDIISRNNFYGMERYIWRSLDLDQLTWKDMPKSISKQIDIFIKSNNININ